MTLEDLKQKYVFSNKNIDSLEMAYEEKMNIVNFGSGGHGKSNIVEDYFTNVKKEPYFLLTCGKGLTVDKLFGGIHISDLTTKGELNYLIENSFMMHKNVVFEELFDSPPEVIEMLKQTLSSGIFSNGNQTFKIKTEFIVANTNRTREEFSKGSRSIDALLERFPLAQEYKWPKYTQDSYSKLIETKLGKDYCNKVLLEILEEFAIDKKIISPRIAIVGAKIVKNRGLDALEFVSDFKVKYDIVEKIRAKYYILEQIIDIKKSFNECTKQYAHDTNNVNLLKAAIPTLENLLFKVNSLPQQDETIKVVKDIVKDIDATLAGVKRSVELLATMDINLEDLQDF